MAVILKKRTKSLLVLLHPGHPPWLKQTTPSAFGVHSQAGRLVKACFLSWPQNTAPEVIGSVLTQKNKWESGGGMGGIHFLKVSLVGVGEEKIDVFHSF